ncbi:tail fiber domain-containing protein [Acetobacter pasteurianus]|uniref:Side tail fiber protein like protein from lambdoid prophage Rac n=1 Tax=Acetobacter pasteurianus subsp. pasteurianus TaxID=481145 RepID=A0A1Y0YA68_ACEPA|nr:tail fiber domain-containing protein [Acetobacter pasteurianus]ARW47875.1 Side tail fiber protein like protein from lambdoid prophage Rac [Acetobacter pasteurianus subsp. pasteurianus]
MATTYGAPTNLDLSACSVTATGGTTSQTLADMGKAVADNATAVATATSNASDAKSAATQAGHDAANALTAASSASAAAATAQSTATAAQTAAANAVQTSQAGAANGYTAINANGGVVVPVGSNNNATLIYGDGADTTKTIQSLTQRMISNGTTTINALIWGIVDSDSKSALTLSGVDRVRPAGDGSSDLGSASFAYGNIYSKTAVQVTSDATQKTVIGSLGDVSYTDGQKLAAALFGLDTCMFQLNASIAEKGADAARLHAGFIAQQVQAAITAAGLDPAKYALWTNTPVYQDKVVDGSVVQSPVLDGEGKQVYMQMLRYDQILCVLFEAAKAKIAAQENALSALTTRVAALEAKAGA